MTSAFYRFLAKSVEWGFYLLATSGQESSVSIIQLRFLSRWPFEAKEFPRDAEVSLRAIVDSTRNDPLIMASILPKEKVMFHPGFKFLLQNGSMDWTWGLQFADLSEFMNLSVIVALPIEEN